MDTKILKSYDEKTHIAIFEWGRNLVHCNVETAIAYIYKHPVSDIPDTSIYLGFEVWNEIREMVKLPKIESIIKDNSTKDDSNPKKVKIITTKLKQKVQANELDECYLMKRITFNNYIKILEKDSNTFKKALFISEPLNNSSLAYYLGFLSDRSAIENYIFDNIKITTKDFQEAFERVSKIIIENNSCFLSNYNIYYNSKKKEL